MNNFEYYLEEVLKPHLMNVENRGIKCSYNVQEKCIGVEHLGEKVIIKGCKYYDGGLCKQFDKQN
ncbi:hypothetical protein HN865_05275 [Candidatus Woesearchaeota archaeon]|jgi:hypothetical protein|nr:hypothetical protein [Candidatus Woesearchaeota archaeon]MBT7238229.1 hypothetical protein [Candidatus Woesearchaeota archaeon]